jgi:hypothetical protein
MKTHTIIFGMQTTKHGPVGEGSRLWRLLQQWQQQQQRQWWLAEADGSSKGEWSYCWQCVCLGLINPLGHWDELISCTSEAWEVFNRGGQMFL